MHCYHRLNRYFSLTLFIFTMPAHGESAIIEWPPINIYQMAPTFDSMFKNQTQLTRDDIEQSKNTNLNGLLNGQSGVKLSQSGGSTPNGMIIGGASGGLGLFTLDGIPLFATLTGAYALNYFPAEFFERVTVQRGNGGNHRGSRTLGGAIHLDSREINDDSAFAKIEAGNYGSLRGGLGKGWNTALGTWTALAERQAITDDISQASSVNGNNESDNFQLTNGLLRGRKNFGNGSADATLLYSRAREDMDGPGLLPNGKRGWMDDLQGLSHNQTWLAQGRVQQQLSPHWHSSAQLGMTRNRQNTHLSSLSYVYAGQLWLLRWQNEHDFNQNLSPDAPGFKVNWGIDLQQQHGEVAGRLAQTATTLTSSSGFLSAETNFSDWSGRIETRLEDHDYYGSKALFAATLGWSATDNLQFWLSSGTGFRPPAVNERLQPLFGRADLQPERVTSVELGGRWQINENTHYNLTVSHRDYRQLIVLQFDIVNGRTRSANVPQAEIWMLENEWQHSWNDTWKSGLTYTFMSARDQNTGLDVPSRPRHQSNLWQEWRLLPPVKLRLEFNFRDSVWFDPGNTQKNSPAPRVNLLLTYQAAAQTELYLRGDNLNNERSPEIYNFGYPGVTFWGGIKTSF